MGKSNRSQLFPHAVLGVLVAIIAVIAFTASVLPAKASTNVTSEKNSAKHETTRGLTLKEWNLLAK